MSLPLSLTPVASVYTTWIVSLVPQLRSRSPTDAVTVSVTVIAPLRNTPLVSLLSVNTSVSVSSTSASLLFPTYTVTRTVSAIWGLRFSSVSKTAAYRRSRVAYVSTPSVKLASS